MIDRGPFGHWSLAAVLSLVSASVIAHQIVIMQMLSIAQWDRFASMVISMAMLGFGAAGTVATVFRDRLRRAAGPALMLLCGSTAVAVALTPRLSALPGSFDAFLLFYDPGQTALLAVVYLWYCLPFFFAGLAVTLVFYTRVDRVGLLYAANLGGSGVGAAVVIALLWIVPLDRLPALLALPPAVATVVLMVDRSARADPPRRPWNRALVAVMVGAIGAAIVVAALAPVRAQPSEYKDISAALQLPGATIVHRSTSPHGELSVVRADALRVSPGLSLTYRSEPPVRDAVFVNGDYFGPLLGFDPAADHILGFTTRGLPYAIGSPTSVVVLSAATGTGVSHALSAGARSVVAVEPNRHATGLLAERHPEWIDSLYSDPRVTLAVESPRAFLSRAAPTGGFDLIVASELGSFGGNAGVDSLHDRFDLTLEAFERAWSLLSPAGIIAVTVWTDEPPRLPLRLLATWRRLLDRAGVEEPVDHLIAVRGWATTTFVLSRRPVSDGQIASARRFADAMGFDPLVMRGIDAAERDRYNRLPDDSVFDSVDSLSAGDADAIVAGYDFDIRPARDDRPFFLRFLRLTAIGGLIDAYGRRSVPYLEIGTFLGFLTLIQVIVVATLMIVVPLSGHRFQTGGRLPTLLFFCGTGTGFMLFEIVLIQQLTFLLGQPVYATAAVIAVLLIGSGIGSLLSSRIDAASRFLPRIAGVAAAVLLCYAVALMPLLRFLIAFPVATKIVAVVILLLVPAVVLGMLFPLGLRRLAAGRTDHIPWACAIDSLLSVTAAVAAGLLAVELGFAMVTAVAAAAYGVSAAAATRLGGAAKAGV
ncbi:MAG: spermidine synthase-like protein [Spirochaetaceae bacterium]|nr:MAG: spermidine synthase-like protein [Spirochaetaceae bacterium]